MQTWTGNAFYPGEATPEEIHVDDIAHALSLQCRYNGHIAEHYSVAQHCVLLHDHFLRAGQPERAVGALLHDAAEAYIGDLIAPIKRCLPQFRELDDTLCAVVLDAFTVNGTRPVMDAEVMTADLRILHNERAALMPNGKHLVWDMPGLDPLPDLDVQPWSAPVAEQQWRARAQHWLDHGHPQPLTAADDPTTQEVEAALARASKVLEALTPAERAHAVQEFLTRHGLPVHDTGR